jgi:deazaflavin-dependent oxidoreductase (nitroreductase family)
MGGDENRGDNEHNIAQFRAHGGQIPGFGDQPVLLLTTIGAKSGVHRTTPLIYLPDEHDSDRVYVFASYAGADVDPAWFHNIVAHPDDLIVEIGTETLTAAAHVEPEPGRTEVYAVQASHYPSYADYETKTTRSIPVVALTLHR